MKLAIIVLCCLFVAPFVMGHWDKDSVRPPYTCKIKTPNGKYCLRKLYKSSGNAWSAADSLGNTIYFNLCGDLSTDVEGTIGCDPTAASCVYTSLGTYINAGRPADDSLSATSYESSVEGEDNNIIQFSYSNGDICPNSDSNYQTTIQLTCALNVSDISITSVNYNSTTCTVLIEANSMYACPRTGHYERHQSSSASLLFFLFPLLCCCTLCICVVACCRRMRRRCAQQQQQQKRQLEMNTYTAVPQQAPVQQQVVQPQQMMQPYIIPTQFPSSGQSSSQFQPQYFQPSPYYVYMPQYPVPYPQQNIQSEPVAPVIPLEETAIEQRESLVEIDERMARELQAKFDNE